MQRTVKDDRRTRGREHSPADERLHKHQGVHGIFRRPATRRSIRPIVGGKGGGGFTKPVHELDDDQKQNRDSQRTVDRHEQMIIGDRGDHGTRGKAWSTPSRPGSSATSVRRRRIVSLIFHGYSSFFTSAGVIALGCLVSPARRCERSRIGLPNER